MQMQIDMLSMLTTRTLGNLTQATQTERTRSCPD